MRNQRDYQQKFLRRLHTALSHAVPENFVEKPYVGVKHLKEFRAGDEVRGYCVFADEPPEHNFFLFICVTAHQYDRHKVSQYDPRAGERLEEMRSLKSSDEAEDYAANMDALGEEDILKIMEELGFDLPES